MTSDIARAAALCREKADWHRVQALGLRDCPAKQYHQAKTEALDAASEKIAGLKEEDTLEMRFADLCKRVAELECAAAEPGPAPAQVETPNLDFILGCPGIGWSGDYLNDCKRELANLKSRCLSSLTGASPSSGSQGDAPTPSGWPTPKELREAFDKAVLDSKGLRYSETIEAGCAAVLSRLPKPPQVPTVYGEIIEERAKQDAKWGEQNHPSVDPVLTSRKGGCSPDRMAEHYELPSEGRAKYMCQEAARRGECTWVHIATEELCEAVACKDDKERRKELVQLAAVIVQWIECLDRALVVERVGSHDPR